MKIVSLVPSITETLFDFGLKEDQIIGRTKFCINPKDAVKKVAVIGGTKNLNIEKIKSLKPDLIIANKEENVKEQVEEIMADFNVMVTNIENLEDNYYFLKNLGKTLGKEEIAQFYNSKIQEIFYSLQNFKISKKAAYLIWINPYMTVGSDTFITRILSELGFQNIFENQTRYPEFAIEELEKADVIMLSSEPYPFAEKHIGELQQHFPYKQIILVDGEAFSWFGTHIAKCGEYYKKLLKSL